MAEKLSWTELRRLIATRAGVSEKTAAAFLNSFNRQLIEALKEDKQVKINGLGTFKLQAVAARKSVNVKTGEEITIPGYNKIVFTSEAGVKELVESNGERRKANGKKRMANGEGMENDPLVKLGVQAAEIVDILGELGQSPNEEPKVEEPKVEEPKVEEPKVEEKPEIPEVPETPEVIVEPEKQEEKPIEPEKPVEKPKKKFHFWRDTLICVVVLMILLVVGFFFFRHQLSSWIRSKVCKQTENTEQVISHEQKAPQQEPATANFEQEEQKVPEKPEILENPENLESPEIPEVTVEETVIEEVVVEEQHYEKWIKTEAITEGSRLAWIAKKYYGSVIYWPYLYDANKDHIDNPNKIKVGTPIRVPKLTKAQKDTTTAQFLKLKQAAEAAIR